MTETDLARRIEELEREKAALEEKVAELSIAEERFRTLFEQSNNAHLIFDERTRGIVACNSAAVAMLRCKDKRELMEIHPAVLSPELQPDGRSSIEKSFEMDALARLNGFHRFEWIHRRMDGEDFPVEVTLTPVRLATGPAILVVWHELTHIKRAEAELREKMAIIEQQAQEIRALSTPILEVAASVLLVPLLGVLDAQRTAQLQEELLGAVVDRGAAHVILDLTGIAAIDTETARRVLGLVDAAALLGTRGVVVGIRRDVALSLVETGVDLGRVVTLQNVRAALAYCLRGLRRVV